MRRRHRALAGLAIGLFLLCSPAGAEDRPEGDSSQVPEAPPREVGIIDSLLDLIVDPDDVTTHIQLANQYARDGKLYQAEYAYMRALDLDPKNAVAWNNLGVVYLRRGREGKALSCFDEALDSDPRHALAHYNKGSVLDVRGKYDRAIWHYRVAFHERPELSDVKINPFLIYNEHAMPALMMNYLSREEYALLVDASQPVRPTRVVGIAEALQAP